MKYRAILTAREPVAIARRCDLVGVSRSGFYAWCTRPESPRQTRGRELVVAIEQVHDEVDRSYGSPRMHAELQARGWRCGRHRVAHLMRTAGIRAKQARRYYGTTVRDPSRPVAPNLLARQFMVPRSNQVWLADLTCVPTGEGWGYLAVVLDAYSRRVVGWAFGAEATAALAVTALQRALTSRRPPAGMLHHSDQGTQYTSAAYQALLETHGLRCSMSRAGNCWDNAVAESFFHSLKVERVDDHQYVTRAEAEHDLADYIERFYNRQRRHSTLGYLSPVMYELRSAA